MDKEALEIFNRLKEEYKAKHESALPLGPLADLPTFL